MSGQPPTERIPLDVLARAVEKSRPRPPAVLRKPAPPCDDDFEDEESPSVLVTVGLDGTPRVEKLPEPTQKTLLSEILAASCRVVFTEEPSPRPATHQRVVSHRR